MLTSQYIYKNKNVEIRITKATKLCYDINLATIVVYDTRSSGKNISAYSPYI
jgi:hypothetical protein